MNRKKLKLNIIRLLILGVVVAVLSVLIAVTVVALVPIFRKPHITNEKNEG